MDALLDGAHILDQNPLALMSITEPQRLSCGLPDLRGGRPFGGWLLWSTVLASLPGWTVAWTVAWRRNLPCLGVGWARPIEMVGWMGDVNDGRDKGGLDVHIGPNWK